MNTTKSTVAEILEAIDATPENMIQVLDSDENWYREPQDVWVRPVSDFSPEEQTVLRGDIGRDWFDKKEHHFAEFYDFTGRLIPKAERPSEWWDANVALNKYPATSAYTSTPNAVGRFGNDYLIVGRGIYYLTDETSEGFVFVTRQTIFQRAREEQREAHAAFLAANPIIVSMQPSWANRIEVDLDTGEDHVLVTYSHDIGVDDLGLTQEVHYKDRSLTFHPPVVTNGRHIIEDGFSDLADELRGLADALTEIDAMKANAQ